jgi:hypothetical protein
MARDCGGAAGNSFDPEDGLGGVLQEDDVFSGLDSRLQKRMVQVRRNINRLFIFAIGLIDESIRNPLMDVLLCKRESV